MTEAEYQRQWRALNPERVAAQRSRSRARHKEKRAAETKLWRANNPERVAEYRLRDAARRLVHGRDNRKAYHQARYESAWGRAESLTNAAKMRATKRGLEFSITAKWVEKRIAAGFCEATGIPFVLEPSAETRRHPFAPSLDRTDSTKGYTKDNVKIVSVIYNIAKADFSPEHLEMMARAVVARADAMHLPPESEE